MTHTRLDTLTENDARQRIALEYATMRGPKPTLAVTPSDPLISRHRRRPNHRWLAPVGHCLAMLGVLSGLALPVQAQDDDIDFMPGRLSAAHEGLEDPDSCENCHDDDLNVDGERCLVCHDQIAARIAAKKGVHRDVTAADCAMCHVEHQGRDADLRGLDPAVFEHAEETGFALLGFHGEFAGDCSRCHTTRSFLTLSTECSNCHQDAHQGTFGDDCTRCHATDVHFKNASRGFHKSGLFPLEGRHLAVPCADCHWNQQIKGTPTRCADCHWIRRQDTPHGTQFGLECETCHQPISWTEVNWDHAAHTGFDNGGQHRAVDCAGCHPGWRFDGTASPDCYSCHGEDYQGAEDPNHVAAGFPTQCDVCHRPSDASWHQATFEHPYRLLGQHATLDCANCHADGIYLGTPTDCVGCHRDDYNSASDPDHVAAGFPTSCRLCHDRSDSSWEDADFDHPYPLVGVHATLECSSCHEGGVYAGTPTDCVGCHQTDYDASRSPNHAAAGFPTDCENCHSQTDPDWHRASYPHTAWPLVASHRSQRCIACHTGTVYEGLPSDCVDCHIDDYNNTDDPNHGAAGFPTTCETCHTPTDWDDADFDHVFPLVGVHATLKCSACHSDGIYAGLPSDCASCHIDDYNDTEDPDHGAAGFPTDCENCHDPSDGGWEDGDGGGFDHAYPLVGVHATLRCSDCHSSGVYAGLPSDCVDCHRTDYDSSTNPNHPAAGFPTDCTRCHRASDPNWQQASYPHTAWPLAGSHRAQACNACHTGTVYDGLPSDCVDCHLEDYNATTSPNHPAAGFPTTCETCHTPTNWGDADFSHPYTLVGVHATLDCSACHSSGVYEGLPSDCVDCHRDNYDATSNPIHSAAGFPTTCDSCHSPSDPDWFQATYPHTVWPLVGSHTTQDCNACHTGTVYDGLPSDCVDCHLDDYNATTDPNHPAAGFPTTCETCHTPTDWADADFTHPYTLVGVHATLDCSACHSSGVYEGLPSDCVDCHRDNYDATTSPDHAAAGFPTTCDSCHSPSDPDWFQATYPHTVWPLVGSHTTQACNACHTGTVYDGLPSDCVDCHLDDYNATTDPNHPAAGFPTTCETCHTPTDWADADFTHPYTLVGVHATLDCSACHSSGVYEGLPSDCVDCHRDNYDATSNPIHSAAGFPTTCDSCHSPSDPDWFQATYPHTVWPLVGSHATQDCNTCHTGAVYAGLPSDCVDCHLADYEGARNPNHVTNGFPTDCTLCHRPSDASWNDGTFNHPYFPITSGPHASAECYDCHIDPSNFAVFSCLDAGCHPQSVLDDKHSDEPGYVYDSAACYSCHPDGRPPGDRIISRTRASHE